MLVRRGLAVLSFAGVASWSGLAGAQYFHADPTVRLTGGYIFNRVIPDDSNIAPSDQSGPLVTLAPSLALTYDTPLVTQRLTLTGTLGLPFASDFTFNGQPPSYNLRLNYSGGIPLDARTQLTLGGGASAAPISGFSTLQDASLTAIDAPPADSSYNFTLNGSESLRRELSAEASLTQSTNVLYAFPVNAVPVRPSTLTVKNALAVSRKWPLDTLTLTGSVGVTRFGAREISGAPSDPRVQILNDLTLLWRRPFTESLTGSLHVGVGQTISPGSGIAPVYQPTGGAQLLYSFAPVVITLVYSYAAVVDIYTATTNLNNQVALRAVIPIATTGLSVSGSGGYVHTEPIGNVGVGLSSGFNSITGDVGLTYSPIAVPKLSLSLRGLYARQVPIEAPNDGVTRVGVSFNVAFSYPSTTAVDVTSRLAPTFFSAPNLDGEVILGQEIPAPEPSSPAEGPTDASDPAAPPEPAPPAAAP